MRAPWFEETSMDLQDIARSRVGKRMFRDMKEPVYGVSRENMGYVGRTNDLIELLMSTKPPKSHGMYAGLTPWTTDQNRMQGAFIMPQDIRDGRLSPRGVAVHEVAHYNDYRLNNHNMNLGFTQFAGGPGEKAGAERPAMFAERAMRMARKKKMPYEQVPFHF